MKHLTYLLILLSATLKAQSGFISFGTDFIEGETITISGGNVFLPVETSSEYNQANPFLLPSESNNIITQIVLGKSITKSYIFPTELNGNNPTIKIFSSNNFNRYTIHSLDGKLLEENLILESDELSIKKTLKPSIYILVLYDDVNHVYKTKISKN